MEISPEIWIGLTSALTAGAGVLGKALHSKRIKELETERDERERYWKGREDTLQARVKDLEAERDASEARVVELSKWRRDKEAACAVCTGPTEGS